MKVRDVMTYGVISVPEGASIAEAVETMLRSRVSALFVFDADHALSGILSEGDLLRRSELGSERKRPYWLELLIGSGRLAEAYAHEHGAKAGEVMTRDVETIAEDAELSEAVDRMIRRRIKRLPVLRGDALVGVVSRSDLLKALLAPTPSANAEHSDAEIKAAILAELDKLEWAPRASVGVEVQNGAVTFTRLDHRRAAARGAQGHCREHARLRRRPRPHGLDRAELGCCHSLGRGRSEGVDARASYSARGALPVQPQAARKKATDRAACGSISARNAARSSPNSALTSIGKTTRSRNRRAVSVVFPARRRAMRRSRRTRPIRQNARHRFRRAFAAHAAHAYREIGKPPRLGDRDPDQPDRFGGENPGQNEGGQRVEPLLD